MAVDHEEGLLEKATEFFTQKPEDREYEDLGGDDDVEPEDRTDDPKSDAQQLAADAGKANPYPDYTPGAADIPGN